MKCFIIVLIVVSLSLAHNRQQRGIDSLRSEILSLRGTVLDQESQITDLLNEKEYQRRIDRKHYARFEHENSQQRMEWVGEAAQFFIMLLTGLGVWKVKKSS